MTPARTAEGHTGRLPSEVLDALRIVGTARASELAAYIGADLGHLRAVLSRMERERAIVVVRADGYLLYRIADPDPGRAIQRADAAARELIRVSILLDDVGAPREEAGRVLTIADRVKRVLTPTTDRITVSV